MSGSQPKFLQAVPENMTPPDAARFRQKAFEDWLLKVSLEQAECRLRGHQKPGYTDPKTLIGSAGPNLLEVYGPCARCGLPVHQIIDAETGKPVRPDRIKYTKDYKLPQTVHDGWGLSADQRGQLRLMLLGVRETGKRKPKRARVPTPRFRPA
jgi:hypothetical protein